MQLDFIIDILTCATSSYPKIKNISSPIATKWWRISENLDFYLGILFWWNFTLTTLLGVKKFKEKIPQIIHPLTMKMKKVLMLLFQTELTEVHAGSKSELFWLTIFTQYAKCFISLKLFYITCQI